MKRAPGLRIGRVFGISVYIHPSWFVIFALITFSLATQFTHQHPQWSHTQHWSLGILTSLLFFGSVLFHELAHGAVATRYRIPVVSITLFVFGGIAHITREPENAKQEFNIAAVGPLSSYLLAGVFWALLHVFPQREMLGALAFWLASVNMGLATFNLLPGFPLDGGRIFRAAVWYLTGSYQRATKLAARVGRMIAYTMIVLGLWLALSGDFFGGIWIAFLGWFLLNASQEGVALAAVRSALMGVRVTDVMSREIPAISGETSLEDYSQQVLRTGRRCHFILSDGRLLGLINVQALNSVPRKQWPDTPAQAAMIPRDKVVCSAPDQPLLPLLKQMIEADVNQVPVLSTIAANASDSRVVGIVTRDSILQVIQARNEVEVPPTA
ncbi:MAG TPA: site-2 protease family protein [Candidatus Eisenbacteria bacterium]|jgi:Zn-dependent protease/predicted transcriptional regulator|nr:site-2 protease family protein [Candidatus Eisenbacteria bacterium]